MAPPAKRALTRAEIGLVQLKNCLVNLPRSLVAVLLNAQTAIQDVVIELQYQDTSSNGRTRDSKLSQQRSIYVGWTGMQSKQKNASIIGRDGGRGSKEETATVEIDMTFARTLGITEYQKVGLILHPEPPLALTVNIEPLTPGDWEIIELHASFLEINLLSQIRALPNPSFAHSPASQTQHGHPLTLHLSPTSTANILISSISPPQASTIPFAKLSPNAEVIVAPKTRTRTAGIERTQSRSIASAGGRSTGGRSGASNVKSTSRGEYMVKKPLFLRPVDQNVCPQYFDEDNDAKAKALVAWVDRDILATEILRGIEYVCVSVVRPAGLEGPTDLQASQPQKNLDSTGAVKLADRIVARVLEWEDAPDVHHVALSSALCSALGVDQIVGGLARIEPAPPPLHWSAVRALNVLPFQNAVQQQSSGLRFGGDRSKQDEATIAQISSILSGGEAGSVDILHGPLTDGLVLPRSNLSKDCPNWPGGILRIALVIDRNEQSRSVGALNWVVGPEVTAHLELQHETPYPTDARETSHTRVDPLPSTKPILIGVQTSHDELFSHISHTSSVLLTGGRGSGKSSMACLVAHELRSSHLFYTSYFSCRKLVTDETRISTIKDILTRIFMAASWAIRLSGKALVILDDLDKLCPTETELQVGNDNDRSKHISEVLCLILRQFCSAGSGVMLLATAESKESLHSVLVGGHIVREILTLKAPGKDARRQILQSLSGKSFPQKLAINGFDDHEGDSSNGDGVAWMEGSIPVSPRADPTPDTFMVDRNLDFLDIAGQTDGYMPGDLVLLVSRARNECLIRSVQEDINVDDITATLTKGDFQQALRGFTPASLRNVTLQSSKTSFDSIGGLRRTRRTLLETLQYPTTYAPIFAQCPLRLRSGLLLYGYPGCGKTLLASAVAGECGLNFISVKGPEILNKYIGASEKSVRDLFERAESARPCVLFFDEFDSIAPKRGHDSTGVTDRVVNQLLTQMDGAEGLSGVYVLAATSRPDLIDPALLRPGRLDKSLICDLPDLEDRVDILHAISKTLKFKPSVLSSKSRQQETLLEVAHRTEGYSGADLQAVLYNAHLEAIHNLIDGKIKPSSTKEKKSKSSRKSHRSTATNDIIQFRFGEDKILDPDQPSPKQLLDNATIFRKLEDIRAARRKDRQLRNGRDPAQASNDYAKEVDSRSGQLEVMIEWKHIEASLASTRSSISREERNRLEKIYREFVVGRNGEMPRGEGPRDVGGRSSLM